MTISLDLGYTRKILDVLRIRKHSLDKAAYVLATAYWETGRTMEPVKEAFYLGSKAEAYRKKLRYYPWYGRGFVQLTWKNNYVKAGKRLGKDFTKDPDLVMDPDLSARILVIGMEEGWFTGKKLSDYIDGTKFDYLNARRIVNGVDKADEIASIAREYRLLLLEQGYDTDEEKEVSKEEKTEVLTSDPWWVTLINIILKLLFLRR